MAQINLNINHIALAVPDVDAAVEFYTAVFGFDSLRSTPRATDRSSNPDAPIFKVYDCCQHYKMNSVRTAYLASGNGIGLELFEFVDPKVREQKTFDYLRGGYYHMAITHPDPNELFRKASEKGAKQIGETLTVYDGRKVVYMSDPWGNVIEILSCSFLQLVANRP